MSLHDQSATPRRASSSVLVVALVLGSSFTSGCAHFAENLSALCTSTAPTYGEEIPPAPAFGWYETKWDRWPCNELTIDRGHRPEEKADKKKTETDTTTDDTTGTQNEMDDTGVPGRREDPNALPDDLFSPDSNAPLPNKTPDETPEKTPEEPGLTPPDPNAPDAMPPDTAPPDATPPDTIPEVTPPATAPEIPEDLFDEKKPPAPPPGHSAWELEPLPTDAPEGSLVSDSPERNRQIGTSAKTPTVATPRPKDATVAPRIESARRKAAVRRTSAIESLPPVDQGDVEPKAGPDLELDGPELQVPVTIRLPGAQPKAGMAPQSATGSNLTRSAKASRQAVVAPLRWPSDEPQLVAPRVSDSPEQDRTTEAERSARIAVQQRLQSRRNAPIRRAVATDRPQDDATP